MPKNLYAEDLLVKEDEMLRRGQLLAELQPILQELTLFENPAWAFFKERLERLEREALEALVYRDDEVNSAREKVRLARYLLNVESNLQQKAAELRAMIDAPMEDYND